MAENIVQVTEGTGKKLHTWDRTIGANLVQDEFTLPGEYPYASYMVNSLPVSFATANSHPLQIMAGASLNVYVRRVWISQHALATTAAFIRLAIYRLTTAGTGGTSVTPLAMDTTDAASGAAGMTLPTVKGTEAASALWQTELQVVQTVGTGGPLSGSTTTMLDFTGARSKSIRIPAGTANGIAFKNLEGSPATTITIVVELVELNY